MQVVDVIVGGQYGSEAKGHVTAQIVKQASAAMRLAETHGDILDGKIFNVRVAGPNAGHTAYDAEGRKFAFRSLPVGAVVDPEVLLYIAPGSEIDLAVLYKEIHEAEDAGHEVRSRLYVSRQATVILDEHKELEAELIGKVGSTGKGIGAARAARIMRTALTIGDVVDEAGQFWTWAEPEDLYATDEIVHEGATHVIIEGTQGYGLSLRASGHYPQVTSSDARSVDFLAMAGIDPTRHMVDITNWVVCRVFPIRVAGNSGPMEGETSWTELGLPEEHTTVTQKVRRVGAWDQQLVARAVQANGGHNAKVIVTMLDQVIPGLANFEEDENRDPMESPEVVAAIEWLNEHASYAQIGAHVAGFTYSPTKILWTNHAQKADPEEALKRSILEEIFGGAQEIAGDDEEGGR